MTPTAPTQPTPFEEWWLRNGQFIDPDTSDVPWFDKRRALAESAFDAAMAQSRNYVADDEVYPRRVDFVNGRKIAVSIRVLSDGPAPLAFLKII